MGQANCFLLPCAAGTGAPSLLLNERVLIQTQGKVKSFPENAGQWGLAGGIGGASEPVDKTALKAFLGQTGIDFADPAVAKTYNVARQTTLTLKDDNKNLYYVLYVVLPAVSLTALGEAVRRNIQARLPAEAVLVDAQVMALDAATKLLGACSMPKIGWRQYLIDNYYGGVAPGQLNTDIEDRIKAITAAANDASTGFKLALTNLATVDLGASPPTPTPTPAPDAKAQIDALKAAAQTGAPFVKIIGSSRTGG